MEAMIDSRISLELILRPEPGALTPVRLVLRGPGQARTFLPHVREAWSLLVRPAAGGPTLFSLQRRARSRTAHRRRNYR